MSAVNEIRKDVLFDRYGDIVFENGDIATIDTLQDIAYQNILHRLISNFGDWKSYKNFGANFSSYIGKPVGANPFKVMHSFFDAPAGQVASTIEDMAHFSIAVMNGKYISSDLLYNEVLTKHAEDRYGSIGLGWYCTGFNTDNLAGYHAGSNGRPRAFLAIKPYKKNAIALTGLNRSEKNAQDFGQLTKDLMAIIEKR